MLLGSACTNVGNAYWETSTVEEGSLSHKIPTNCNLSIRYFLRCKFQIHHDKKMASCKSTVKTVLCEFDESSAITVKNV